MTEIFGIVKDVGLPTVLCLLMFFHFVRITTRLVHNLIRIAQEMERAHIKKSDHLERVYNMLGSLQITVNYLAGKLDAKPPIDSRSAKDE